MSQGYIKLHRQLQNHPFWQEKRIFSKAEAWIDLLFMANHKDKRFLLGNEWVEVQRGSFITSELKLMDRWRWSKSKVRAFLDLLQNDSMIVKKTDHKKTAITIVNYGIYQDSQTSKEPQKDREQTAKRPQKDTNNNEKNEKNEKNNILSLEIQEFRKRYSPEQVKIVDDYLDILRTTRVSGKLAVSVIYSIYQEMEKHPPLVVQASCKTIIESPNLHDKKENYFFGMMRNTKTDEALRKLNNKAGSQPKKQFQRFFNEGASPAAIINGGPKYMGGDGE